MDDEAFGLSCARSGPAAVLQKIKMQLLFAALLTGLAGCASVSPDASREQAPEIAASSAFTAGYGDGFVLASLAADEVEDIAPDDEWDPFWDDEDFEENDVNDPFEGLNRAFFDMNDLVYQVILTPVSRIYGGVVPVPLQTGVRNFFDNLRSPARIVNNLLQGKGSQAGRETQKFLLNSTAGVLGFGRPSDRHEHLRDIPREDMGQTLAVWGIRDTPYLVLPLLGPSTVRDGLGMIPDGYLYPPVFFASRQELLIGAGVDLTNRSPGLIRDYEGLKAASVDPYAALRNAYLENRRHEVAR